MRKLLFITLLVMLSLLAVSAVAADNHGGMSTTVVINLSDLGMEFGAVDAWEGSLYAGAVDGEETSGRFTEWVAAENGVVVFSLPEDVREGDIAPFDEENGTYIRVRSTGEETYPSFDFVGLPFTLTTGTHVATVGFQGVNMTMSGETTEVTIHLEDFREGFGAVDAWETSIYAGAVAGEETSGRFTEWVVAEDGMVSFTLPDDVREGDTASFGAEMDTYIRVRSVGDEAYPSFDFVARPFTLIEGEMTETMIFITGSVSSSS